MLASAEIVQKTAC
jgi:hypothetical protein